MIRVDDWKVVFDEENHKEGLIFENGHDSVKVLDPSWVRFYQISSQLIKVSNYAIDLI